MSHRVPPARQEIQGFPKLYLTRTAHPSARELYTPYSLLLTLICSGYRQSAHAIPVLNLVAVRVIQHVAVARPRDVTDGFAFHYTLESGGLAANYSYVF